MSLLIDFKEEKVKAMEQLNDKLSIKNLLFTKALPNYVISVPVNGHKVFTCTDCGDKFVFESSYNDHVNRKSLKISYMCRYCNKWTFFYNRCNLLMHIRSHVFKTATINVTDLKIEPLPLSEFKMNLLKPVETNPSPAATNSLPAEPTSSSRKQIVSTSSVFCFECKQNLAVTGIAYKDRASHFMQYSEQVFSCPVCLFALPSICALKTHVRLHLRCPPFYCPECGVHLSNKNVNYPYNHDCEGFKMMRATARLQCGAPNCSLFHPGDYKDHMKENHMTKVYKCPYCVVACFNEATMQKHLLGHNTETSKPLIFYQCDLCPGKFVLQSHTETHLKSLTVSVFPCWPCGRNSTFKDVSLLLQHFKRNHNTNNQVKNALTNLIIEHEMYSTKPKRIYRVVKRCDQCQRSFTYKCKYEEIHVLPNECPYKCTSTLDSNVMPDGTNKIIKCHLCKSRISQDWIEIKKHYAAHHKQLKCVDLKVVLSRIDISKYLFRRKNTRSRRRTRTIDKIHRTYKKRQGKRPASALQANRLKVDKVRLPASTTEDKEQLPASTTRDREQLSTSTTRDNDGVYFKCITCSEKYDSKLSLQKHMISHRDPCMAYQCMECGKSFVVKPSFSKHLLLEHGISDTDEYVTSKNCYNENALMKYQSSFVTSNEPLGENQCTICREQFEDSEDLEKHFRVHGMAFIMKKTSKAHSLS